MNFKKTKIAAAVLSATLLFGCGGSGGSTSAVIDYLTESEVTALLSAEQIAELEAAGLSAADLTTLVSGATAEEIQAAIDTAIANVGANKYVVLTDTSTSTNAQLVYTLPTAQATGKLTAKIKVDSSDAKLSYVTLFNATNSVNTSPLDLKIGGSNEAAYGSEAPADTSIIYSRGKISGDTLTDLTLSTLTWVNISLEWNGSTVDVVISDLDGNVLSSDTLDYQDGVSGPVTKVAFQVSDSSNTTTTDEPIAIDDIVVYDTDLTTVVFSDEDFADLTVYNSYRGAGVITEGEVIEYITELTAEQIASLEAVGVDSSTIIVGDMTQEEVDAAVAAAIAAANQGEVTNKVAAITDTQGADTGNDTGELRYKFASGLTTGKHTLSLLYDADETESAYVSLFDTANSTSSLIGELKIDEGNISLRGEDALGTITTFTVGQWIDIEMSWDTSSTTEVGTYTFTIDGTEFGPYTSQNATPGVEVTATTIKFSSNSGTATTTLYADDYMVYSDVEGTVAVLEEDFESYEIGADLDDNGVFNSATSEAVVAADPSL